MIISVLCDTLSSISTAPAAHSQFLPQLRQSTARIIRGDVIKVIWQLWLGAARPGVIHTEGHRLALPQLGTDTGTGDSGEGPGIVLGKLANM